MLVCHSSLNDDVNVLTRRPYPLVFQSDLIADHPVRDGWRDFDGILKSCPSPRTYFNGAVSQSNTLLVLRMMNNEFGYSPNSLSGHCMQMLWCMKYACVCEINLRVLSPFMNINYIHTYMLYDFMHLLDIKRDILQFLQRTWHIWIFWTYTQQLNCVSSYELHNTQSRSATTLAEYIEVTQYCMFC